MNNIKVIRELIDQHLSWQWCRDNLVVPLYVEESLTSNLPKLTFAIANKRYLETIGKTLIERFPEFECDDIIRKSPEEIIEILDLAASEGSSSQINKELSSYQSKKIKDKLNPSRRRMNRVLPGLLNPLSLIWLFLSFYALIVVLYPPTPIWQWIIGLPVALLSIYWLFNMVREDILGDYERLAIKTNQNICLSNYWDAYQQKFKGETIVKTNFSAGYFLLNNFHMLESIPFPKGVQKLSFFWTDPKNMTWYSPETCLRTLSYIEDNIANFIESSKTKQSKKISSQVIEGIEKDCQEFFEIISDLNKKDQRFHFELLSQSAWNDQIYYNYRKSGYCI